MKYSAIVILLAVALIAGLVWEGPAQTRRAPPPPPSFRYQHVGPWVEVDRLDGQGSLTRFKNASVQVVSVFREGANPDSPYTTVNVHHTGGKIRVDCDNLDTAITFLKFLTASE